MGLLGRVYHLGTSGVEYVRPTSGGQHFPTKVWRIAGSTVFIISYDATLEEVLAAAHFSRVSMPNMDMGNTAGTNPEETN